MRELRRAIEEGQAELFKRSLEEGADANRVTRTTWTPLKGSREQVGYISSTLQAARR